MDEDQMMIDDTLEDALTAAGKIIDHDELDLSNDDMHDLAIDLAWSVLALHDFLRAGGELPKEWAR